MSALTSRLLFRLLESDDLDDRMLDLDTNNPHFSDFDFAEVCAIIAEVLGGQVKDFNFEKVVLLTPADGDNVHVSVVITFHRPGKRKIVSMEQWTEMRGRIRDYIGDVKDVKPIVFMPGHDVQNPKPSVSGQIVMWYIMS